MNEKTTPREILFRGKRTDSGEWAYGYYVYAHTDNSAGICTEKDGCIDVDPATVGQYTGLTDKNSVKIFEGDIIKGKGIRVKNDYFEIRWSKGCCGFLAGRDKYVYPNLNQATVSNYKVIGNVHDNPELLSGKEETGE